MTIQSQLDQVLALAEKATVDNAAFIAAACNFLRQHGPAIRAAVGGEAKKVAWISKENLAVLDGYAAEKHQAWVEVTNDPDAAEVTLYASPPATVDAGALRELVEKWRTWADGLYRAESRNRIRDCADELSAPIGEKA